MGHEDFLDIYWVSSQNWTMFRDHFYAFYGFFLKVKVQNRGYFLGLLKFQILFGVLEIPDIFFFGER